MYVKSTHFLVGRCVKGFRFPPTCRRAERRHVEGILQGSLEMLEGLCYFLRMYLFQCHKENIQEYVKVHYFRWRHHGWYCRVENILPLGRPPIERRYDTAVRFIVLKTINRTRIRDQKVSACEQNCILLPRAHFLIVRAQIENNRSYGRIVYTLYWRSA